jgi:hypothetical protein
MRGYAQKFPSMQNKVTDRFDSPFPPPLPPSKPSPHSLVVNRRMQASPIRTMQYARKDEASRS